MENIGGRGSTLQISWWERSTAKSPDPVLGESASQEIQQRLKLPWVPETGRIVHERSEVAVLCVDLGVGLCVRGREGSASFCTFVRSQTHVVITDSLDVANDKLAIALPIAAKQGHGCLCAT